MSNDDSAYDYLLQALKRSVELWQQSGKETRETLDVARGTIRLADYLLKNNRTPEALSEYLEVLKFLNNMTEDERKLVDVVYLMGLVYERIGGAYLVMRKLDEGMEYLDNCDRVASELLKIAPENPIFVGLKALACFKLIKAHRAKGAKYNLLQVKGRLYHVNMILHIQEKCLEMLHGYKQRGMQFDEQTEKIIVELESI